MKITITKGKRKAKARLSSILFLATLFHLEAVSRQIASNKFTDECTIFEHCIDLATHRIITATVTHTNAHQTTKVYVIK